MVQTAENWRDDDAMSGTNPMAGWHRRKVWSIRNAGPQARVRTPAIVVCNPLAEGSPEVTLVEQNHPVQTLAANRPDHAFAKGVRLRRTHRCFENRQTHGRERAIDAV